MDDHNDNLAALRTPPRTSLRSVSTLPIEGKEEKHLTCLCVATSAPPMAPPPHTRYINTA